MHANIPVGERLLRLEMLIEAIRDEFLVDIKEQTTKTNGRVTEAEKKIAAIETDTAKSRLWISFLWTAIGVVASSLFTIILLHIFK